MNIKGIETIEDLVSAINMSPYWNLIGTNALGMRTESTAIQKWIKELGAKKLLRSLATEITSDSYTKNVVGEILSKLLVAIIPTVNEPYESVGLQAIKDFICLWDKRTWYNFGEIRCLSKDIEDRVSQYLILHINIGDIPAEDLSEIMTAIENCTNFGRENEFTEFYNTNIGRTNSDCASFEERAIDDSEVCQTPDKNA